MSVFYAMIPDNINSPDPVFTRYGRLTKCLATAKRIAARFLGKVYETTGHAVKLVADFWVEPKVKPALSKAEIRAEKADAALFGVTTDLWVGRLYLTP